MEEKLTGRSDGTESGLTPPIISVIVPTKTPESENNPGANAATAKKINIGLLLGELMRLMVIEILYAVASRLVNIWKRNNFGYM